MSGRDWSEEENDLIVAEYFRMLEWQQAGVPFQKSVRNQELRSQLSGRSRGSIEFKHQNISAALHDMELPFLEGYWPAKNYQSTLVSSIEQHVHRSGVIKALEREIERVDEGRYPSTPEALWRRQVQVPAVVVKDRATEGAKRPVVSLRYNFAERDAANRTLGESGERFVLEAERQRLRFAHRNDLAAAVEWSSRERGDGLGFDVRSFESNGEEIFIEVKTTNVVNIAFPFLISHNEVEASKRIGDRYRLHRLFSFTRDPRFYVLSGAVDESCSLRAALFSAEPRTVPAGR